MAKRCCLAILLSLILLLSGCWSSNEIEQLAIVSAIGIDRIEIEGKTKWQVTVEIFHPAALAPVNGGGGGGEQSAAWVVFSIGDTLGDAVKNLNTRTPRILFLSHAHTVVIGKETAEKEDLAAIFSILFNSKDIRLRTWVLVADGPAVDVLTASWELETDLANEVRALIEETRKEVSKAEVQNLKDVGESLLCSGKDVITGKIEVFPTPKAAAQGQHGGEQGAEAKSIRLRGASVFSEGKLAGWFNDQETRGYLFISGKTKEAAISLKLHSQEEFDATIRITSGSSKIKPEIQAGEARIKIEIEAEGELSEVTPDDFEITSELLKEAGKKTAIEIKKDALGAIAKAQAYRADVFGFGQLIYRKNPGYWREVEADWRDHFVNLPVEVDVKVNIRRMGMFIEPIPSR